MAKYAYSSADHNDLFNEFNEVLFMSSRICIRYPCTNLTMQFAATHGINGWNNEPLNYTALMNTWIYQRLFPTVVVVKYGDRLLLCQEPFKPVLFPPSPYGYVWYVPVVRENLAGERRVVWVTPNRKFTGDALRVLWTDVRNRLPDVSLASLSTVSKVYRMYHLYLTPVLYILFYTI